MLTSVPRALDTSPPPPADALFHCSFFLTSFLPNEHSVAAKRRDHHQTSLITTDRTPAAPPPLSLLSRKLTSAVRK